MTRLPQESDQLAARALDGDREALGRLMAEPALLEPPRFQTTLPALALAAKEAGLEPPGAWNRQLILSAFRSAHLERDLQHVGHALDGAGIPWMPIKGMDLAYRLWPDPASRPTSDLDVLVPYARFSDARAALIETGWTGLSQRPVDEQYLHAEGYNWQARNEARTLLELHFRLWPSTPAAWVDAVWSSSIEAPHRGGLARSPSWADAFLLCAVHLWQLPPPHALLYFRELELIARRGGETALTQVAESARRWGLSLQLCLAARYAARLWQNSDLDRLASNAQSDLRLPELLLLQAATARGIDAAPLGSLYVARLLSGRETRHGWKVAFRRLRPHPAHRSLSTAVERDHMRKTNEP